MELMINGTRSKTPILRFNGDSDRLNIGWFIRVLLSDKRAAGTAFLLSIGIERIWIATKTKSE